MEVVRDIRNELFKRNEIILKLDSEKNPSFDEAKKKISEELKKSEENIDVYNIKGSFGRSNFVISANVYDSKEDLDNIKKLEITSKKRKENKDSEGKEEEKTDEVKDEVKVEESKDEEVKEDEGNISNVSEVKDGDSHGEESEEVIDTEKEETTDSGPVEDRMPEEKPEKSPVESPVEERPEEEQKAVEEEKQKEEEAKE